MRWKVENPDGDELDYRLAFREQNEAVWRPLGGPDPLTRTDFDWNTDGLPDGNYVVRVTASDERAEPRDRVLTDSLESAPILVDNRKPEVVGLAAKYPFVSGRARDDQSPLGSLEYAVDGGEWQMLSPADGICDDLVEAFTLKLPALPAGPARGDRARVGRRRQRRVGVHHRPRGRQGEVKDMSDPVADDTTGLPPAPEVIQIEVGLLQNFCEILFCPETREAAIVDPAFEMDRLLHEALRHNLNVKLALITHTHHDHIDGVGRAVRQDGRGGGREPA